MPINAFDKYYTSYLGIAPSKLHNGINTTISEYRDVYLHKQVKYVAILTEYDGSIIYSISQRLSEYELQKFSARRFRRYSTTSYSKGLESAAQPLTEPLIRSLHFPIGFDVESYIEKKSRALAEMNQFVVVVDDVIAATAWISEVQAGGANIIVHTDENHRRMGYGRQVVGACINWCLSNGLVPIYLVEESNVASVALAESLGMVCESEEWIITETPL